MEAWGCPGWRWVFRTSRLHLSRSQWAKRGRRASPDTPTPPLRSVHSRSFRSLPLSALGEVPTHESYRGQGPAGEDQVYAHQEADCPVCRAGELGQDEDADQE